MAEHTTTSAHSEGAAKGHGPAMGDIVCYHHTDTPQNPGTESPAIVLAVPETPEGALRLLVFGHGSDERIAAALPGEDDGQWTALGAKPTSKAAAAAAK